MSTAWTFPRSPGAGSAGGFQRRTFLSTCSGGTRRLLRRLHRLCRLRRHRSRLRRCQPHRVGLRRVRPLSLRVRGRRPSPLTQVRRAIAEHMVRSRQTSPHAYVVVEAICLAVSRIRDREKGLRSRGTAWREALRFCRLSRARLSRALQRHPTLNASWSDAGIAEKKRSTRYRRGARRTTLIVLLVCDADRPLSITGLATTMADLGAFSRAATTSSSTRSRAAPSPSTTPALWAR